MSTEDAAQQLRMQSESNAFEQWSYYMLEQRYDPLIYTDEPLCNFLLTNTKSRRVQKKSFMEIVSGGVLLGYVLEALIGSPLNAVVGQLNLSPTFTIQKVDNIGKVLQIVKEYKGSLDEVRLYEGIANQKMRVVNEFYGILFSQFVLQKKITYDGLIGETALLKWVQDATDVYKLLNVTDFDQSFTSGIPFLCLMHRCNSSLVQLQEIVQSDPVTNLKKAIAIGEKFFGIPPLFDANCLTRQTTLLFLSQLFLFMSKKKQASMLSRSIALPISFRLRIMQLEQRYLDISANIEERLSVAEANLSVARNLEDPVEVLEMDYLVFRAKEKPSLADRLSQLIHIQTELSLLLTTGKRRSFKPPPNVQIQALSTRFNELSTYEAEMFSLICDSKATSTVQARLMERYNETADRIKNWADDYQTQLIEAYRLGTTLEQQQTNHEEITQCIVEIEKQAALFNEFMGINTQLKDAFIIDKEGRNKKLKMVEEAFQSLRTKAKEQQNKLEVIINDELEAEFIRVKFAFDADDFALAIAGLMHKLELPFLDYTSIRSLLRDAEDAREVHDRQIEEFRMIEKQLMRLGTDINPHTVLSAQDLQSLLEDLRLLRSKKETQLVELAKDHESKIQYDESCAELDLWMNQSIYLLQRQSESNDVEEIKQTLEVVQNLKEQQAQKSVLLEKMQNSIKQFASRETTLLSEAHFSSEHIYSRLEMLGSFFGERVSYLQKKLEAVATTVTVSETIVNGFAEFAEFLRSKTIFDRDSNPQLALGADIVTVEVDFSKKVKDVTKLHQLFGSAMVPMLHRENKNEIGSVFREAHLALENFLTAAAAVRAAEHQIALEAASATVTNLQHVLKTHIDQATIQLPGLKTVQDIIEFAETHGSHVPEFDELKSLAVTHTGTQSLIHKWNILLVDFEQHLRRIVLDYRLADVEPIERNQVMQVLEEYIDDLLIELRQQQMNEHETALMDDVRKLSTFRVAMHKIEVLYDFLTEKFPTSVLDIQPKYNEASQSINDMFTRIHGDIQQLIDEEKLSMQYREHANAILELCNEERRHLAKIALFISESNFAEATQLKEASDQRIAEIGEQYQALLALFTQMSGTVQNSIAYGEYTLEFISALLDYIRELSANINTDIEAANEKTEYFNQLNNWIKKQISVVDLWLKSVEEICQSRNFITSADDIEIYKRKASIVQQERVFYKKVIDDLAQKATIINHEGSEFANDSALKKLQIRWSEILIDFESASQIGDFLETEIEKREKVEAAIQVECVKAKNILDVIRCRSINRNEDFMARISPSLLSSALEECASYERLIDDIPDFEDINALTDAETQEHVIREANTRLDRLRDELIDLKQTARNELTTLRNHIEDMLTREQELETVFSEYEKSSKDLMDVTDAQDDVRDASVNSSIVYQMERTIEDRKHLFERLSEIHADYANKIPEMIPLEIIALKWQRLQKETAITGRNIDMRIEAQKRQDDLRMQIQEQESLVSSWLDVSLSQIEDQLDRVADSPDNVNVSRQAVLVIKKLQSEEYGQYSRLVLTESLTIQLVLLGDTGISTESIQKSVQQLQERWLSWIERSKQIAQQLETHYENLLIVDTRKQQFEELASNLKTWMRNCRIQLSTIGGSAEQSENETVEYETVIQWKEKLQFCRKQQRIKAIELEQLTELYEPLRGILSEDDPLPSVLPAINEEWNKLEQTLKSKESDAEHYGFEAQRRRETANQFAKQSERAMKFLLENRCYLTTSFVTNNVESMRSSIRDVDGYLQLKPFRDTFTIDDDDGHTASGFTDLPSVFEPTSELFHNGTSSSSFLNGSALTNNMSALQHQTLLSLDAVETQKLLSNHYDAFMFLLDRMKQKEKEMTAAEKIAKEKFIAHDASCEEQVRYLSQCIRTMQAITREQDASSTILNMENGIAVLIKLYSDMRNELQSYITTREMFMNMNAINDMDSMFADASMKVEQAYLDAFQLFQVIYLEYADQLSKSIISENASNAYITVQRNMIEWEHSHRTAYEQYVEREQSPYPTIDTFHLPSHTRVYRDFAQQRPRISAMYQFFAQTWSNLNALGVILNSKLCTPEDIMTKIDELDRHMFEIGSRSKAIHDNTVYVSSLRSKWIDSAMNTSLWIRQELEDISVFSFKNSMSALKTHMDGITILREKDKSTDDTVKFLEELQESTTQQFDHLPKEHWSDSLTDIIVLLRDDQLMLQRGIAVQESFVSARMASLNDMSRHQKEFVELAKLINSYLNEAKIKLKPKEISTTTDSQNENLLKLSVQQQHTTNVTQLCRLLYLSDRMQQLYGVQTVALPFDAADLYSRWRIVSSLIHVSHLSNALECDTANVNQLTDIDMWLNRIFLGTWMTSTAADLSKLIATLITSENIMDAVFTLSVVNEEKRTNKEAMEALLQDVTDCPLFNLEGLIDSWGDIEHALSSVADRIVHVISDIVTDVVNKTKEQASRRLVQSFIDHNTNLANAIGEISEDDPQSNRNAPVVSNLIHAEYQFMERLLTTELKDDPQTKETKAKLTNVFNRVKDHGGPVVIDQQKIRSVVSQIRDCFNDCLRVFVVLSDAEVNRVTQEWQQFNNDLLRRVEEDRKAIRAQKESIDETISSSHMTQFRPITNAQQLLEDFIAHLDSATIQTAEHMNHYLGVRDKVDAVCSKYITSAEAMLQSIDRLNQLIKRKDNDEDIANEFATLYQRQINSPARDFHLRSGISVNYIDTARNDNAELALKTDMDIYYTIKLESCALNANYTALCQMLIDMLRICNETHYSPFSEETEQFGIMNIGVQWNDLISVIETRLTETQESITTSGAARSLLVEYKRLSEWYAEAAEFAATFNKGESFYDLQLTLLSAKPFHLRASYFDECYHRLMEQYTNQPFAKRLLTASKISELQTLHSDTQSVIAAVPKEEDIVEEMNQFHTHEKNLEQYAAHCEMLMTSVNLTDEYINTMQSILDHIHIQSSSSTLESAFTELIGAHPRAEQILANDDMRTNQSDVKSLAALAFHYVSIISTTKMLQLEAELLAERVSTTKKSLSECESLHNALMQFFAERHRKLASSGPATAKRIDEIVDFVFTDLSLPDIQRQFQNTNAALNALTTALIQASYQHTQRLQSALKYAKQSTELMQWINQKSILVTDGQMAIDSMQLMETIYNENRNWQSLVPEKETDLQEILNSLNRSFKLTSQNVVERDYYMLFANTDSESLRDQWLQLQANAKETLKQQLQQLLELRNIPNYNISYELYKQFRDVFEYCNVNSEPALTRQEIKRALVLLGEGAICDNSYLQLHKQPTTMALVVKELNTDESDSDSGIFWFIDELLDKMFESQAAITFDQFVAFMRNNFPPTNSVEKLSQGLDLLMYEMHRIESVNWTSVVNVLGSSIEADKMKQLQTICSFSGQNNVLDYDHLANQIFD